MGFLEFLGEAPDQLPICTRWRSGPQRRDSRACIAAGLGAGRTRFGTCLGIGFGTGVNGCLNSRFNASIEEIRFRDAVFSYPGSDVTYHFDYRFTSGRKYLVVGENGIGKTTMIRMLAGLCPLQRGEILANGTLNINGMCEAAKRAKIAVLPQDVVPFDGVLSLGPTEPVGPAGGLDDSGSTASFSGGQKKMAFLSSVFASQADVTILDEPYAELDAAAKDP